MKRHVAWLPLAGLLCPVALPAQGLSGGASMRVEVEVYKGPAGQSLPSQVGQLSAVLAESVRATRIWVESAKAYMRVRAQAGRCVLDEGPGGKQDPEARESLDCASLRQAIQSGEENIFAVCEVFPAYVASVRHGIKPPTGETQPWTLLVDACRVPALNKQLDVKAVALAPAKLEQQFALRSPPSSKSPTATEATVYDEAGKDRGGVSAQSPKPQDAIVLGSTRVGVRPWLPLVMANWEELDRRLSAVATEMKSKALRAADANVAWVPRDGMTRSLVVSFAFLTSEYANQIESRMAILVKLFQAADHCRHQQGQGSEAAENDTENCDLIRSDPTRARTLPMSDYLRTADSTDMLQLYEWLRAAPDGSAAGLDREGRIAMARRLTADHFWQKVNEVHASGQGEVAMAFIKDDLGNWNLKSYSNDPAELLGAYRKAADAALKAVVKLAGKAVNPASGATVGAAQRMLGLANQIATGETTTQAPSALDPATLHARALAKLQARRETYATRQANLTAKRDAAPVQPAATEAEIAAKEAAVKTANDALATLAEDARTAAKDVLDDHLAVIAALQEAASPPAPVAEPAPAVAPAAPGAAR